ncbi:hypothetical protein GGE65_006215 [Skermanella aerolata]
MGRQPCRCLSTKRSDIPSSPEKPSKSILAEVLGHGPTYIRANRKSPASRRLPHPKTNDAAES